MIPQFRIWSPMACRLTYLRQDGAHEWSRTTNNRYLRPTSLPLEYMGEID